VNPERCAWGKFSPLPVVTALIRNLHFYRFPKKTQQSDVHWFLFTVSQGCSAKIDVWERTQKLTIISNYTTMVRCCARDSLACQLYIYATSGATQEI